MGTLTQYKPSISSLNMSCSYVSVFKYTVFTWVALGATSREMYVRVRTIITTWFPLRVRESKVSLVLTKRTFLLTGKSSSVETAINATSDIYPTQNEQIMLILWDNINAGAPFIYSHNCKAVYPATSSCTKFWIYTTLRIQNIFARWSTWSTQSADWPACCSLSRSWCPHY